MGGQSTFRGFLLSVVFVVKVGAIRNQLVHQLIVNQPHLNAALLVGAVRNDVAHLLLHLLAGSDGATDSTQHDARHRFLAHNLVDEQQALAPHSSGLCKAVAEDRLLIPQVVTVQVNRVALHHDKGVLLQLLVDGIVARSQRIVVAAPPKLATLAMTDQVDGVQLFPSVSDKILVTVTITALAAHRGSHQQQHGTDDPLHLNLFHNHYPLYHKLITVETCVSLRHAKLEKIGQNTKNFYSFFLTIHLFIDESVHTPFDLGIFKFTTSREVEIIR